MKSEIIFPIIMITILIIFGGLALWSSETSFEKDYKFYSEWCPRLGAEIVEKVDGYSWRRECYRVDNNSIMTKYYITEINTTDRYYLREYK